jgi:ubiquinone/menaquinone biosynthesis C-methylase UbiE
MNAAAAFDRIAATYDAQWTDTPAGRAQRDQVWRYADRLFHAGDAILDIGCGTGVDAVHFAAKDVRVHAVDASAEMIRVAARRGNFTTAVSAAEEIDGLEAAYDGAVSNFGALNCVAEPSQVARHLARLVQPGGRLALCVIGRFCLWESLYYAARLQFRKALRRVTAKPVMTSMGMPVYYPMVADLRAAFAPDFACERWTGIGLFVPPSYVRLPRAVVRVLGVLDRLLAGLPLLRGMADHRLLLLVRK